ncbi:MAG TPA: ABC-F family ATP-binding cassette domain-containing protein [Blastocatellia bacterium]|jgi:ATP-binding cassette subfamily F protein uup|nr:ABC-F family ATP-binding cassette domain-containing protein [Blastocatellia bacterium]
MNIISLEAVSKSYGVKPLFEGVTFGLDDGEKVGVIGTNGSGKSTLLRIIAGREQPDVGRAVMASQRVTAYLPQNPPFDPEKTVLDTVFAASNETMSLLHDYEVACRDLSASGGGDARLLDRVAKLAHQLEAAGGWNLETNAKTVLTRLGITDTSARMGALSGGQRKRVALAHALVSSPDLLILDEPTNHLDADTIAWLETYLARYAGALLLVTHDRYFLDRVTSRIIEIDRGRVQSFAGNYAYYVEKKEEQEAARAAASEKREALMRRELAWLRRGAKARTTKQKARVDRAEELMRQPGEAARPELDISVGFSRMGKKILELDRISKSYGDQKLIEAFSYNLKRGDRIGIIGPNGSGKTTLLDMIVGRVEPDGGRVEKGQTVVIGYYDQENRELNAEQRVIDYVREVAERIETADGQFITASQMLEKFMFPPATQYDVIGRLSGGERRRLYLLRVLMSAPNVLLLDEPTNDLDIQTLVRLEEYLDSFAGCLIVVSHDRYFLDRTAEHVFRFDGGGSVREYPGNYSAFLEARMRDEAEAGEAAKAAKPVAPARQSTGVRKLSYKERREFEELEERIEAAEKRKAEIERRLAESASDFVIVQSLYAELGSLKQQLDNDVDRWAELAEFA